ncbi:membrane protein [Alkalihalobacillus sp. LMS39]|uniref:YczE/YyaS/YitT family protein n=1 Tax=Alkalihalobacillus sp. LMS39 TaxID=2924032 RepID=UPI001FB241E0|nr:membrane protein [Alkalihalobacillus sp. LMS39]UOE94644.1 membrane protein [Alkalihalobacillus sp. LMS39]
MSLTLKRGLCYVFGLFILSCGVSLTINANLGVGPWDALTVGLSQRVGLTVGTWVIIVSLTMIGVNALLLRKRPEVTSILTTLLLGYFVDFWLLIAFRQLEVAELLMQIVTFAIGLTLISIGVATYLQARFAPIPVDGFMIALQTLFGFKLMVAKMLTELLALLLALFVAGPIGFGTLIVALFIGPYIQFWYPKIEKIVYQVKPAT